MRKLFLISIALVFALLSFGCLQISYDQKLSPDGASVIRQSISFAGVSDLAKSFTNDTEGLSNVFGDACANVTSKDASIQCTSSEKELVLTKSFSAAEAKALYSFEAQSGFPFTTYVLSINRLPSMASQIGGREAEMVASDLTSNEAKESAAQLETLKAGISYRVEMPGTVTAAEGGVIVENKASFDVIELMKQGKPIVVRSQELNVLAVAAVFLVIAIVGVAAFVLLKKKPTAHKKHR